MLDHANRPREHYFGCPDAPRRRRPAAQPRRLFVEANRTLFGDLYALLPVTDRHAKPFPAPGAPPFPFLPRALARLARAEASASSAVKLSGGAR